MIVHDGATIPTAVDNWDPSDVDCIWIAWDNKLNGASIIGSVWTVPANWTIVSQESDQAVISDENESFAAANGVLLSTTEITGKFTFANKVTLSDGKIFERSVKVKVKQL